MKKEEIIKQPAVTICGYIHEKDSEYWSNYFNSPPADFIQGIFYETRTTNLSRLRNA